MLLNKKSNLHTEIESWRDFETVSLELEDTVGEDFFGHCFESFEGDGETVASTYVDLSPALV